MSNDMGYMEFKYRMGNDTTIVIDGSNTDIFSVGFRCK